MSQIATKTALLADPHALSYGSIISPLCHPIAIVALDFPKNANVVAAVALAGIGFDRTEVELIADPTSHGNRHVVCAQGPFGQLVADVLARTFPENPKTSVLTPYSILRAMENLDGSVVI